MIKTARLIGIDKYASNPEEEGVVFPPSKPNEDLIDLRRTQSILSALRKKTPKGFGLSGSEDEGGFYRKAAILFEMTLALAKPRDRGGDSSHRFADSPDVDIDSREQREWAAKVARDYFEREKQDIIRDPRYRGKYIAIVGERIVDFDEDLDALEDRVDAKYPKVVKLMEFASEKGYVVSMPGML